MKLIKYICKAILQLKFNSIPIIPAARMQKHLVLSSGTFFILFTKTLL